ncbi:MFS transporter [Marinobacterium nitratireducens]|uniref:MFS transporter n=1 Tax=Marinobacterium nitratireducens TaxID=518897 RepID=A0A917ZBH5_9GAMM|nr:MFS transporter [Marinobacterium nitratireducens]
MRPERPLNQPLPAASLWRYAAPGLPLAMPTVAVYVLLPTWYAEQFALPLALIGAILLLTRLFDVVTDPLIGLLLDRRPLQSPRSPMLAGALLCTPALILLVNPPESLAAAALVSGLLMLYLGWTLIQIPYLAWLTQLHDDSLQRNRAAGAREALTLAGLLISAAFPALSALAELPLHTGLNLLVLTTLLVGVAAFRALWRLPAGRIDAGELQRPQLSLLRENRLAMRLLSGWFLNGLANGLPAVLFPLFVSAFLGGDEADRGRFILLYFASAVLSLPVWLWLSRYISRSRLWCLAMLLAIMAFAPAPLLDPSRIDWFVPICVITGAALGADLTLPHVIQAEVADWDRYRFRAARTGLLFACWNMATKLALALSAGCAFMLLGASGFAASAPEPLWLLAVIYALLPCVFKAMAIGLLWRFPLQQGHHRAIRRRLARRHPKERGDANTADDDGDHPTGRMQRYEN